MAKTPSEVSLLDITETINGPITINECLNEDYKCLRLDFCKETCFYHHIFDDINNMITGSLSKITLDNALNNSIHVIFDNDA